MLYLDNAMALYPETMEESERLQRLERAKQNKRKKGDNIELLTGKQFSNLFESNITPKYSNVSDEKSYDVEEHYDNAFLHLAYFMAYDENAIIRTVKEFKVCKDLYDLTKEMAIPEIEKTPKCVRDSLDYVLSEIIKLKKEGFTGYELRQGIILKESLTIPALKAYLEKTGRTIALDVIKQECIVTGQTESGLQLNFGRLVTTLQSELANVYKGTGRDTVAAFLQLIAEENPKNPPLEHINSLEYDGTDWLNDCIFPLLGIDGAGDELSRTLMHKWLLQSYALLNNSEQQPFGAEGVLVLVGAQGIGKTAFLQRLAMRPEWFQSGQISTKDKDHERRLLTSWIAELGEIGETFRGSDRDKIKRFVTEQIDHYRLPYSPSDIVSPRRTSLAATANDDKYLVDTTGNRRFFTVPIEHRMPYDDIQTLIQPGLWAQIREECRTATAACKPLESLFRLTADEFDELNRRNSAHETPLKGEEELQSILDGYANEKNVPVVWKWTPPTDWTALHPSLSKYTLNQIGMASTRCGVQKKRSKHGMLYYLPFRHHA